MQVLTIPHLKYEIRVWYGIGIVTHLDCTRSTKKTFSLDYIDGYEERNQIREKIRQCFEGINVHGLPMLSIPEGESVDYQWLNGRFKVWILTCIRINLRKIDFLDLKTRRGGVMAQN